MGDEHDVSLGHQPLSWMIKVFVDVYVMFVYMDVLQCTAEQLTQCHAHSHTPHGKGSRGQGQSKITNLLTGQSN